MARLGGSIVSDPGDPLFCFWVIEWVSRAFRHGLHGLWDAPIFFPVRGTLALSDHLLGLGAVDALLPPGHTLLVYDVALLLSFPLAGASAAFVLRRLELPPLAAWLGGLVFAFAPYRWASLSHLPVLLTAWCIPLLLWLWDRLLAAPRARTAAAFLALYAVHLLGGAYLAYMVHVPLLAIALVRARSEGRALLRAGRLRVLLPTVALATAIAATIYGPYLVVGERLGVTRSRGEMIAWGATLVSYLTPSWLNLYAGEWMRGFVRPENQLFAGFLPTALAALGLVVLERRTGAVPSRAWMWARRALLLGCLAAVAMGDVQTLRHASDARYTGAQWLLAACVAGLLLLGVRRREEGFWPALAPLERGILAGALACALLTLPMVFLAARVLPGLAGMRVPARFYPFVSFGIAWLVAVGFAALLPRLRQRGGVLVALGLAILLAVDLVPTPVPWVRLPALPGELPPAHQWLRRHHAEVRAYLELPMENAEADIQGMYFQTAHWVPSVNGYSGYFPHAWARVRDCCAATGMGPEQLAELRADGVTHLVISSWKTDADSFRIWQAFARRLLRQRLAEVKLREGGDTVLALLPPSAEAAARAARARERRAAAAAARAAAGSDRP